MYHYVLRNTGIIFPLTLVVHVLLIVISPTNVLWMRITNEQNSATMVTINLKVSMFRYIIANSNITKAYTALVVLLLTLLSMLMICVLLSVTTLCMYRLLEKLTDNTLLVGLLSRYYVASRFANSSSIQYKKWNIGGLLIKWRKNVGGIYFGGLPSINHARRSCTAARWRVWSSTERERATEGKAVSSSF